MVVVLGGSGGLFKLSNARIASVWALWSVDKACSGYFICEQLYRLDKRRRTCLVELAIADDGYRYTFMRARDTDSDIDCRVGYGVDDDYI